METRDEIIQRKAFEHAREKYPRLEEFPDLVPTFMAGVRFALGRIPEGNCSHPELVENPDQPGKQDYLCTICNARILIYESRIYAPEKRR